MKKITQLAFAIMLINATIAYPMESLKQWLNDYIFFWKEKDWNSYFQEKLYQEPRDILMQALKICNQSPNQSKKVLDLGAGAGNETAYLLQHGWTVWANDREQESIKIIGNRTDVLPYKNKLTLIQASFTDIPWATLPSFNLITALYTLPFLDKNDFYQVWNNIINHVEPRAIIAITLFGPSHAVFGWWKSRNMSFFTKKEILDLFKDFDIKIFEESLEKNNKEVMEHIFTIVAQKK